MTLSRLPGDAADPDTLTALLGNTGAASSRNDGTASLDKALDVLDAVGQATEGMSQADLAARLGLPRTTVYRMLGTLVSRGLLRRDPVRRVYALGSRCFEYARAAYVMPDLAAAAMAELRSLRDMTGETTYLAILDGHEAVSVERMDGAHSQRSSAAIGQRKPLHCTSQGKAMLAALATDRRETLLRELPLPALTPRSLTDRRRLQAELRLTASRGWAIDDEEVAPGVRCCGAAIVDPLGQVRGAISVAGPAFRLTLERLELIGPEVAEAARRIGAQLSPAPSPRIDGAVQAVTGEWAFDGAHPVWAAGALYWADTLAPSVHRAGRDRDRLLATLDAPVQALLPHAHGVAVLSGDAWQLVGTDGGLQPLRGLPVRRPSATCTSSSGRLWACVPDSDRWRVLELGADGTAVESWRLNEPATALAWDPTRETLHIAIGGSGALYTARRGRPTLQRLTTVPRGSGMLAGLALDREGGIWSAMRGGWSAVRFLPDGSLDQIVSLPVPCPTGVAFGGERGDMLYITSARDNVTREALEAAPLSGRLFAAHSGTAGLLPAALG
ncbi:MAG: IclR family transcriptional regulator C-terminal domain-containing protein [Aquabacterium sp.]